MAHYTNGKINMDNSLICTNGNGLLRNVQHQYMYANFLPVSVDSQRQNANELTYGVNLRHVIQKVSLSQVRRNLRVETTYD